MVAKITVIGSINMDLVTKTNKLPKVGETVLGDSFFTNPGGKGANQAVAAAKLGAEVSMIGCIGDDTFGKQLKLHLTNQGVSTTHIETKASVKTGVASITLSENDNSIIVVPGANHHVTPELIEKFEEVIAASDIILLQLEIPIKSVEKVVELAKKHKVLIILNPAPYHLLSQKLLNQVDFITPNEHEYQELLKTLSTNQNIKEKCIVTRGSKGITYQEHGELQKIPSFQVNVVDTTGAGDAFNGALAVGISEGKSIKEACKFACAVGALAVGKIGAQTGMPTREEVEAFLLANECNAEN